jgi:hypothetical protein
MSIHEKEETMVGLKRLAGASLVVALFAGPAALQAQEVPECQVQTDLTEVPVSAEPVSIVAVYEDELGEEIAVAFAEESGVEIVSIEQDPDNPLLLMLTLDTSGAASGDWELVIEGETARCVGEIEVADLEDIKPYQR